jgi:hypothetical protein
MMEAWCESDSLLTPLIIGYQRPHSKYSGVSDAFVRASQAVPATKSTRVVGPRIGSKKFACSREVVLAPGLEGLYPRRALLMDRPVSDPPPQLSDPWLWEVGFILPKPGSIRRLDPGLMPVVLETSRFKVTSGALEGAVQLALFRHLFVASLRCLDANLTVLGGTDRWDVSMWRLAGPEGEGSTDGSNTAADTASAAAYCDQCGVPLERQARFCAACGARVGTG